MYEILKKTYKLFLQKGWTLNQIDESDIFFLFELSFGESEKSIESETVEYAEQVPWL